MRMAVFALLLAALAGGKTYYVDCALGSDSASGTSSKQAWKTLKKVSSTTFAPGESILLRRGSRCSGMLWPKGSGQPDYPIHLGAYGAGPLPVVDAGTAQAAIKLFNQQQWEIENLETTGGSPYGVYIGATEGSQTLSHFQLRNLVVHDVSGEVHFKASGLVVIASANGVALEDILIDGVTAYRTSQWAGIFVSGSNTRARNVIVRNSVVHDVEGDGIVIFLAENGLIEKSAAWHTGLQDKESIGTPNAIWTWSCRNCIVQNTEGFWTDSPGVDGGVFDIDWGNENNIVQYNYGHDAQGYCVAVFGAEKKVTTNSIVRYNVCLNNGRSPKLALRQGDLYTSTWDGGSLDGVLIHNNTFIWNPPINAPAVHISETVFSGARPNRFINNLVYSSVPSLVRSGAKPNFQGNIYWYSGRTRPSWFYGDRDYSGIAAWRAISPGENFADPKLDWMLRPQPGSPALRSGLRIHNAGPSDAFGALVNPDSAPDVGAIQHRIVHPTLLSNGGQSHAELVRADGRWMLLLFAGAATPEARSQLVFVQTALAQYGAKSLTAATIAAASGELEFDWHLGAVVRMTESELTKRLAIQKTPTLLLVSPAGEIAQRWNGFVAPAELGLTLTHFLGAAPGNPTWDFFSRPGRPGADSTSEFPAPQRGLKR